MSGELGPEVVFKISDAVALFTQSSGSVQSLWNFYMVASFAAAGFAASAASLSKRMAGIITAAYCLFLAGHLSLLQHSIEVENAISAPMRAWATAHPNDAFSHAIAVTAGTTDSWFYSCAIHLLIDASIIAVIWSRALRTASA